MLVTLPVAFQLAMVKMSGEEYVVVFGMTKAAVARGARLILWGPSKAMSRLGTMLGWKGADAGTLHDGKALKVGVPVVFYSSRHA